MGKVTAIVGRVVALVIGVAVLGVGIASLITLLNVQDMDRTLLSATETPPPSTKKSPIPIAQPIQDNDPRFAAYNGMSTLLSSWMNTSVDPCDDFYAFTCGAGVQGQARSFDLCDDAIAQSMLGLLRQPVSFFDKEPLPVRQMKWFYDACMNDVSDEEWAAQATRIFNDLRTANPKFGFPALFPKESTPATPDQLAAFLGYSIGTAGISTLVDVGVDTDWKDPHNSKGGYALLVDQPATLYGSTYYTKTYDRDSVVAFLVDTMNSAAQLLGIKDLDQKQVLSDAQDMADFDFALATKYSTDETTRRQFARSYNPRTVDGLQTLAPFLNWETYFNKALAPVGKTVDGSFRSIVMETEKLALLSSDVASGSIKPRTLNNYLYVVSLSANFLPELTTLRSKHAYLLQFRREKRHINRRIRQEPPVVHPLELAAAADYSQKESNCQNLARNYLSWANTRVYVDANYPSPKDKQAVRAQTNAIVRSILAAFRAQIDLLDWMSPSSKRGAYQKMDNLVVNVAFPDWVMDDARITDYYKKLTTSQKDTFIDHLDKLSAFGLFEAFSPLVRGTPADRTDFSGPAAITNAWYQPEMNSITLPGGILHAPYYDANYPAALNFGGIGVVAGHELTHGFDDEGVQWEGTGALNGWMDDNSTTAFTQMASCVVQEYGQFCPLGGNNPCVDGAQTQGENIADNGGIQAAYKAFKAYETLNGPDPLLPGAASLFSADQLFFLGFAQVWCQYPPTAEKLLKQILTDPHSPSHYRVLGTIQNIPAFQKAFNCPANSVYAPTKHCDVWTSEPTSGAPLNEKGEPDARENDVNIEPIERISAQDTQKYAAYQTALDTFKASSNFSEKPCDDFYHYSCGEYPGEKQTMKDLDDAIAATINERLNAPDYAATIASSSALVKLKTLYTACVAEARAPTIAATDYVQPKVLNLRKYLGQDVPLFGGSTANIKITPENYGAALGYLSFQLGIDTLVSPSVDINWVDPQAADPATTNGYQLFVDQPTTYHGRAFYEDGKGDAGGGNTDDNWAKQKPAYKKNVVTVLEAYARQDKTVKLPADYVKMIDDALELEQMMAIAYSGTDMDRRNYSRQWNPMMVADFPVAVDWTKYWSFAPKIAQDWTLTKPIVMPEAEKTAALFVGEPLKNGATVVNYLFIRLLLANAGLIPCASGECAAVRAHLEARHEKKNIGMKRRARSRRHRLPALFAPLTEDDSVQVDCADQSNILADAFGRVYIDARYPTEDDRQTIIKKTMGVMNNTVNAMKGMIIELDWMSEDSKMKAIHKASNIQVNVAFPDFILDNKQLDAEYSDLSFAKGATYFPMLDTITLFLINQQFKLLSAPKANRKDFLDQTAVVDAWYEPMLNSITFPAGILQQPYFDVNYPAGLNYGGIGHVAGHELTHGFDDEGVQWDFDGRINSWMDDESQDKFNTMAQCVIEEYNKFCPLPADRSPRCTNGVRTQGENIADNGGLHSAWRAYLAHKELDGPDPLFIDRVYSQYTEDQLFFRNNAQLWCMAKSFLTEAYVSNALMNDPHAIGPYRILGSHQNIPAFRAAFNCPLGTTYAPLHHCPVWVPTEMA